jgi:ferredoxin-type protein NapG
MSLNRREWLQGGASAVCAGLLAAGAALVARPSAARPAQALRPPGALAEERFEAACLRCGLCVRACSPGNLRLSTGTGALGRGVAIGTPYFEARDVPCEMCESVPCVKACPSGALDPQLTDITRARMGLAVLVDQASCLNFQGLRCDVCYRVCPLVDQAITLQKTSNPRSDRHALLLPTVHADACTGCGKCEKACVLETPAIKVLPITLAQGAGGAFYRKGWEEQQRRAQPGFEYPTPRLPEQPLPGELRPLRGGEAPYRAAPAPRGAASEAR